MSTNEHNHSNSTVHPSNHQNVRYVNLHGAPIIIFVDPTSNSEAAVVMFDQTKGEVVDMHYCENCAQYEQDATCPKKVTACAEPN